MNKELKRMIVNFMFDNHDVFGLLNMTIANFHPYIYDDKGEYLVGGQDVADYIKLAEKLV